MWILEMLNDENGKNIYDTLSRECENIEKCSLQQKMLN